MNIILALTNTEDILRNLGEKVRSLRLACNWTREELSKRSAVPYSTLRRLESTGQGSMHDYVMVFRTLGALDGFETLLAPPPVSPYELQRLGGKVRQRARARGSARPAGGGRR